MNRQIFIFQIEVFVNWAVKLDRSGFACRYPPKAAKAVQCSALPQKMTSPQFERHWTDLPIDNLNLFDFWHVGNVIQFYAIRFSSQLFFFVALDAGTGAWESFQSVSLADHGRPVLCPRQYRRVALSHHPDKGGSKQAFVRLQGAKASWWCKIAKHGLIIIINRYYQPTNARNTKKRSGIKKQTSCWAVCYHAPNWGLHARSKCCGTLGGRGP